MASVTKRGSKWYAMWNDALGRPRQKVTPATTKTEAMLFAREKERQAWRQREGLEPLLTERLTFGELMDWWWERYGSTRRAYTKEHFHTFVEKQLDELRSFPLTPATAGEFADRLDKLLDEKGKVLAPQSVNHLRSAAFGMFERARDPKHRKWVGENPVRWVKRRKIPKSSGPAHMVLAREEVLPALAGFPEPSLARPWRWIAASCILAGTRPGEAFGLWKEDVDTQQWVLTIRRSWSQPLPKDDEARDLVIVPELRPHLLAAMKASPSKLVFPRPDGSLYEPKIRFALRDQLRRALRRAGIVDHYKHTCRRKGCGFSEARQAATDSRCPTCSMRLWVSPVARSLTFYDLRHYAGSRVMPVFSRAA